MTRIDNITLHADATGTLELVCERAAATAPEPNVRLFAGKDEFGLLVDDLNPNEQVTLFFETATEIESLSSE